MHSKIIISAASFERQEKVMCISKMQKLSLAQTVVKGSERCKQFNSKLLIAILKMKIITRTRHPQRRETRTKFTIYSNYFT